MSARTNPFEELERMAERMTRQFDEAARAFDTERPLERLTADREAPLDVVERDEAYAVTVDLPGFERGDVAVEVSDHSLRVTADREETVEESDERYLRRERRHESVHRTVDLPEAVDADGATARMNHGVLSVRLPRREHASARTLEIE